MALDKRTGELIWKSALPSIGRRGKDGAGYSSMIAAEIDGVRQYIQILGRGAVGIEAKTGASIDIDNDGTVTISCVELTGAQQAYEMVEMIAEGVKVGTVYDGRVTSVKDFGAFIEVAPGQDGLCHISGLSDGYVNSVSDVCRVGDEMRVKVILVDDQGRVKLSRKAVLKEEAAEQGR